MKKWTAPSCKKCNEKLGAVETDIFNRLAICLDENDIAASGVSQKFIDNISVDTAKNPKELGSRLKLLIETAKNYVPYPYEEGNPHVLKNGTPKEGIRGRLMIRIPNDKLYIVSEKIIRGLEFHLRSRLIEQDRKLQIIIPHAHQSEEEKLTKKWQSLIAPIEQNSQRGPGFNIKYGINPIDNDWVIYNVIIWNHLEIWAIIHPQDNILKGNKENLVTAYEYLDNAIKLYNEKNYSEALKLVNLSISFDPNNFSVYTTKAHILYAAQKPGDALDAVDMALKINPNNFKIIKNKVALLMELEKYHEAITTADQAITLNQLDYYIWHMKGASYYYLGEYENSITAFNEALRRKPDFFLSAKKKIWALIAINKFKEATKLFEMSHFPKNEYNDLLNGVGYAYLHLNRYTEAGEYLNRAKLANGGNSQIYYNLYRLNLKLKKYLKSGIFYVKFRIHLLLNLLRYRKNGQKSK